MDLIKRFFNSTKKSSDYWKLFRASKAEMNDFFISIGDVTIGEDYLEITNYPFEPSIAFRQTIFLADQINDIDLKSFPPTIRLNDELIFLSAEKKNDFEKFTIKNNIKTVERPMLWEWLLEPFLDTEFTAETEERLNLFLGDYGLNANDIKSVRSEVETQMLKYNFDTMLWEWVGFSALDVLRAMRTKYNKDEFRDFYKRVMTIALLTKTADE